MLRGLTTVSYFADDVATARDWYAEVLGTDAYFARPVDGPPAYVEFRIGDYQHELGLLNAAYLGELGGQEASTAPGGVILYWHVDDVQAVFDRLLHMGATVHDEPVERGPGFVTASVVDPFGNILGVMFNQHYLDMLAERG